MTSTVLNFFIISFLCIFSFLYGALFAHASLGGLEGMVVAQIEISPQYPTPGDEVKAVVKAPTIDTDIALITWKINGKVVRKTYETNAITFIAGSVGETYTITATLETERETVAAQIKTQVSDVALVWEGKTYTPPFYEGRALQSQMSRVALTAIPSVVNAQGKLYDRSELSYIWSINYSTVPSASGRGLHSVLLTNDLPNQNLIVTLQVKDTFGEVRAVKKVTIPVTHPQTIFYEDSPLVGIRYDHAIQNSIGVYGRSATLVAEPYYSSVETRTDPLLEYTWTIEGDSYNNPGNLSFEPTDDTISGNSYLDLVIKNTKYWLQNTRTSTTIEFGQRSAWSDVGLEQKAL